MQAAYRSIGYTFYWPAWVHLLVVGLLGVAAVVTVVALMARAARRPRAFGLPVGLLAAVGNLSLCVLVQAEARHTWQTAFVFLLMTLASLWSAESGGFRWSRTFHLFLLAVMAIAGIMEFAYRLTYWIPLPVAGVAVLLALLGAFAAGRASRD